MTWLIAFDRARSRVSLAIELQYRVALLTWQSGAMLPGLAPRAHFPSSGAPGYGAMPVSAREPSRWSVEGLPGTRCNAVDAA